jgi:hypothetical protein
VDDAVRDRVEAGGRVLEGGERSRRAVGSDDGQLQARRAGVDDEDQ